MNGVGSQLEKWIPEWALIPEADCNCEAVRDEMNRLGPDGVLADLERFEEHFLAQRKYLRKSLQKIPEVVLRNWVRLLVTRACQKVKAGVDQKATPARKRKS